MRVAFVVQRYGRAVNGGAELHCRQLAEHVARAPGVTSVRVLTTCAVDYRTWRNASPAGVEDIEGVRVERFETVAERRELLQSALSTLLFRTKLPGALRRPLEQMWLDAQGPLVPSMLHRIDEVERETDLFVFFTYLYYPTVRGLPRVAEKALLVPTAHDEPPLRLDIFRELFAKTKAFAFNTPEERDLIDRRFGVGSRPQALVGSGVDIPDDILPSRGLDRPFILYVGRISKAKGLEVLCDGFARFKREHGAAELEGPRGRYLGRELELRIAGGGDWARLPRRSDVIREGFVDDARKQELLRDCELMVVPSLYESLSLVLLEAWAYGRAALVERRCAVTRGQVQRSGGGAAYSGSSELSRELRVWLASARAREQAGLAGRRYVQENYAWPAVERRFLAFAEQVLA